MGHSHNATAGVGYHPTWRGYDSYVGVPYSIDMGCTNTALDDAGNPKQGCATKGPANKTQLAIPLYNATRQCDDSRGATCSAFVAQQPADLTALDEAYGDAAASFLARFGPGGDAAGTPFFAYMPFSHVHVPLSHSKRFQNASKRNNLFADTLLEMDATVGRVVAALKANGLERSTLILVVGDNGPWNAYCNHAGSQGPFVGGWVQPKACPAGQVCTGSGKFTTWEGGHREASLAWLPGVVPAGTVSNATMHVVDFFPTLAAFAGLPLPADRVYDGIDQSPVLTGRAAAAVGRDTLYHQSDANFTAARMGQYKAHFETWSAQGCTAPGASRVSHNPPLVFDLDADPGETTPLAPEQMPPGLQQRFVQGLGAILAEINSAPDTHKSVYKNGGFPAEACCNTGHPSCAC